MRYKTKVTANVEMTVWIHEDAVGNKEIEDIEDIDEINDWEEK